MMYPTYGSGTKMCGGHYSRMGRMCQWEVTTEGAHQVARFYGDSRYEGKDYIFPTRIDALEALEDMIYAEVS